MTAAARPVTVWLPGPLRLDVHLRAEDTGGAFSLLVDHPGPDWALPPHRHLHEAETVHVVEGRFETTVEGEVVVSGPGDTVHVPRGAVHSGRRLDGDGPGRRVLVFSPGGMDRFFLEAGTAEPEDDPDLARLLEVAGRYGWRFG